MATVINGSTGIDKVQDDAVNPVTDVTGGIPCFSAVANAATTLTNNTTTQVLFQSKEFDTTNDYSTVTCRYTPQVAGYYFVKAGVAVVSSTAQLNRAILDMNKNTTTLFNPSEFSLPSGQYVKDIRMQTQGIVYMNGTTDFLTVTCTAYSSLGTLTVDGSSIAKFQAHLIVGA